MLLKSFNHCLHKNLDIPDFSKALESINDVNEWEDGQTLQPAPEHRAVHDPSLKIDKIEKLQIEAHKMHRPNSAAHSIASNLSDEIILQGQKVRHHSRQPTEILVTDDMENITKTKSPVFRMVLDAKNREIAALKQQLYEVALIEKIEHSNVDKLQKALGKAVKFYKFADEWKEEETHRLKDDVLFLKSYISSLMAFMLSFDEEKAAVSLFIRWDF